GSAVMRAGHVGSFAGGERRAVLNANRWQARENVAAVCRRGAGRHRASCHVTWQRPMLSSASGRTKGEPPMVFRISLLLVVALAVIAGFAPGPFGTLTSAALSAVISHAGWLYLLIVFLTLVFLAYLAFGPFARLRIGGRDAEPEFSGFAWLSMLFAAGMGIGLVFWGAAEPVSHLVNPPEGLPSGSPQAARAAMRYTFFHWGLHPWAIYALMGLA